jgi:hypothetical protein
MVQIFHLPRRNIFKFFYKWRFSIHLCPPFELGSDLLNIEPLCRKTILLLLFWIRSTVNLPCFSASETLAWLQFEWLPFLSKKRQFILRIDLKNTNFLVLSLLLQRFSFCISEESLFSSKYQRNNKFFFRISCNTFITFHRTDLTYHVAQSFPSFLLQHLSLLHYLELMRV